VEDWKKERTVYDVGGARGILEYLNDGILE
jgi:hypothetical protein